MGIDEKIAERLSIFSLAMLIDFANFLSLMVEGNCTIEEVIAHVAEKQKKIEEAHTRRRKEWLEIAPKCPACQEGLNLYPIYVPKGKRNLYGYQAVWQCEAAGCTYEKYEVRNVQFLVKELYKNVVKIHENKEKTDGTT